MLPIVGAAVVLNESSGKARLHSAYPEWIRPIPLLAISSDAGPVVECCRTATPATVNDVRDGTTVSEYSAVAIAHGITGISAVPLCHGDRQLGAVGLYLRTGTLSARAHRIAHLLGDAASIGLRHWQERHRLHTLARQLQHALDSRVVIEQAKGIIAERHRLPITDAFARLRRFARQHRLPLHEVARQVTGTTSSPRRRN